MGSSATQGFMFCKWAYGLVPQLEKTMENPTFRKKKNPKGVTARTFGSAKRPEACIEILCI